MKENLQIEIKSRARRNILETLKQHRDDDVSKGQAVKNQKVPTPI